MDRNLWRVYGGQPVPRVLTSKRAAHRLMRRYRRLGIQASLYSGDSDRWTLVGRWDMNGEPYSQPGDAAREGRDGGH